MAGLKSFCRYWLPALLWLGLIFSFSGDAGSSQQSSRILEPLLRWLFPEMPLEQVGAIVYAIRKLAHVVEYAILGMLLWRALARPRSDQYRPWNWRIAVAVWLLTVAFAAVDEIHQSRVPSRQGRVADVMLDGAGAAAGLLGLWAVHRWRHGPGLAAPSGQPMAG